MKIRQEMNVSMARKEYLCKAERSYLYNVGYHKNFPRPKGNTSTSGRNIILKINLKTFINIIKEPHILHQTLDSSKIIFVVQKSQKSSVLLQTQILENICHENKFIFWGIMFRMVLYLWIQWEAFDPKCFV